MVICFLLYSGKSNVVMEEEVPPLHCFAHSSACCSKRWREKVRKGTAVARQSALLSYFHPPVQLFWKSREQDSEIKGEGGWWQWQYDTREVMEEISRAGSNNPPRESEGGSLCWERSNANPHGRRGWFGLCLITCHCRLSTLGPPFFYTHTFFVHKILINSEGFLKVF